MSIHIPEYSGEEAADLLDDVLYALTASLPDAISSEVAELRSAKNHLEIASAEQNLAETVIDWSRIHRTNRSEYFSTSYCKCIMCGQSVGDIRGIEDHIYGVRNVCPVFKAIVARVLKAYQQSDTCTQEDTESAQITLAQSRDLVLTSLAKNPVPRTKLCCDLRSGDSLEFAIQRMLDLGFEQQVDKQGRATVERWTLYINGTLILGNPWHNGSVSFTAWAPETLAQHLDGKRVYAVDPIHLHDSWRRDLLTKLLTRAEDVLGMQEGSLVSFCGKKPLKQNINKVRQTNDLERISCNEGGEFFLSLPHKEVLKKARSMSRKELIERFNLSAQQAGSRIAAAVAWEKASRDRRYS